jgi:hypothetical protein
MMGTRKIFIAVIVLVLITWCLPGAADDIEAVLDSADGSSAFVVKDSGDATVASIDSDGEVTIYGDDPSIVRGSVHDRFLDLWGSTNHGSGKLTLYGISHAYEGSAVIRVGNKATSRFQVHSYGNTPRFSVWGEDGGVRVGTTETDPGTNNLAVEGDLGIGIVPDTRLHVVESDGGSNIAKFNNSTNDRTTYINQWGDLYIDSAAGVYTNKLEAISGSIDVNSDLELDWSLKLLESAETTTNLLGVGATSYGSADKAIAIGNAGTVPSSSITDGVLLYAEDVSDSSELKVRDEAGNVTTLSPHHFELASKSEPMAWSFYSENHNIGKKINVDMLKIVRLLEDLTGEKLVYIADIEESNSSKITEESLSKESKTQENINSDTDSVIPSLVKSVQKLEKKVERLEKENQQLEKALNNYRFLKAVNASNSNIRLEALKP